MSRKHVILNDENEQSIINYMNMKSITFSKAINELLSIGLRYEEIFNTLKNIEMLSQLINNRLNINLELLKQFYSDMGIVGLSNPNECMNLQKFFLNRNKIGND